MDGVVAGQSRETNDKIQGRLGQARQYGTCHRERPVQHYLRERLNKLLVLHTIY